MQTPQHPGWTSAIQCHAHHTLVTPDKPKTRETLPDPMWAKVAPVSEPSQWLFLINSGGY